MTISLPGRRPLIGILALAIVASAAGTIAAIELDVSGAKIDAGLRIARGPESGRAAFHRPYQFSAGDRSIEQIEVITEYRRLVLLGQERIAIGDHLFEQGGRIVEEAMRPWRRRVSVVARVNFPFNNAYISAPQLDIALDGPSGSVPRIDHRNSPQYLNGPSMRLIAVDGEAVFDATAVGQTVRTAVIRLAGREVARVTIDFSRLD